MTKLVRFWRQTPRLAKAAFILAGIGVAYLVLLALLIFVTSIMARPPGGSVAVPVVMALMSGVIAFGLRSSTLAFKWVGVGLAALLSLFGLLALVVTLVSTDFSVTTGNMGDFAVLGLPLIVMGLAYIPIAALGAREALRMGQGGKHQALGV